MEICFTETGLLVRCKSWSTHLKGYPESAQESRNARSRAESYDRK